MEERAGKDWEKPFEMVLTQECVDYCPIEYNIKDLCILNYQIQKYENKSKQV